MRRNRFAQQKERRRRDFLSLRKLSCNRFQLLLVETHATDFDRPVRLDQKNSRHTGQSISVRRHVPARLFVKRHRKRRAKLLGKLLRIPSIVLRNAQKRNAIAAIPFVKPLQKRKRKLANRT